MSATSTYYNPYAGSTSYTWWFNDVVSPTDSVSEALKTQAKRDRVRRIISKEPIIRTQLKIHSLGLDELSYDIRKETRGLINKRIHKSNLHKLRFK